MNLGNTSHTYVIMELIHIVTVSHFTSVINIRSECFTFCQVRSIYLANVSDFVT